ncbi:TonB-dependent receptor [Alteromonas sp. a30]|uniref:TonB-dependent receptor n=1 Tax=Alteromonas sp. a30 TaxID=2730917 RepID=UPI0022803BF8|nr:TonB-dependent receptor [Alteromonas sp. a30]MCY7296311.1 TonB-dependent receptor [Alteromonas sp. a30]
MNTHHRSLGAQLSRVSAACLLVLAATTGNALAQGDLQGRVTDKQQYLFNGAQVEIKELGLKQTTARDGSFYFSRLQDGNYTLKISYLGADSVEYPVVIKNGEVFKQDFVLTQQSALEEVVVKGQRSSVANALNRQKNAKRLVSIVSSDSIGQFPDQNAAEALQRLPGLFIQRDQGEGRFVGIRGIDPNLNNLTINGANIPAPESGVRSVALDVIPSELIEGLEVTKSVTSDMDADAVGGSVEVKSLSAFDRDYDTLSLTAQGSYSEQTEDTSPKLSGSYTKIFEFEGEKRLGLAAAVSWFERDFGSLNVETDGGWGDIEFEDAATGEDVAQFGAEEIEQRFYRISRERLGAALNLDYHTSATDQYYLRTLYSKFSDDEFRLRNEYKFDKGQVNAATWTDTAANFTDAEMDRDTKDRYEEQKILSIVAGGENRLNEWHLDYSLGYSKSEESEPNRFDVSFAGEGFDLGYVARGAVPELTQSNDAHDLGNFELDEIVHENNFSQDEELSVKFDLSRDFVWNNYNGEVKFGAKWRDREKLNDKNVAIYDGGFDGVFASQFVATRIPDYSLGNFGPGLSRQNLRAYFNSTRNQLELNQNESTVETRGGSYNSEEDIAAAYAMVTLDVDKWSIVAGLRYESTDFSTQGSRVELIVDDVNDSETVAVTPWEVSKDYDHLLPSLNVRYDFSEKLLARFAFTQTIARPSFGDSAAFQLIETETEEDDGVVVTERKAEVGNPDLDPYESTNLDVSIEYYPGKIGVLSAGFFYKDIDNFIVQAEVQDNGQWDGFEEVVQPINGGSAKIKGVELAWTKSFDSGLLIATNATFTNADADMPNQADSIGNIALGYETQKLSTRLTLTHKSKTYQFEDSGASVYQDAHNQVDFNAKYFVSDNLNIYFNAININDEPLYLYHGNTQYNYQYESYGTTYELGVTWNAF